MGEVGDCEDMEGYFSIVLYTHYDMHTGERVSKFRS